MSDHMHTENFQSNVVQNSAAQTCLCGNCFINNCSGWSAFQAQGIDTCFYRCMHVKCSIIHRNRRTQHINIQTEDGKQGDRDGLSTSAQVLQVFWIPARVYTDTEIGLRLPRKWEERSVRKRYSNPIKKKAIPQNLPACRRRNSLMTINGTWPLLVTRVTQC